MKKRTKKISGGKKIGEGGYGCVITPSIPCKKDTKLTVKNVSKLVKVEDKEDFEDLIDEIEISNILRKTDRSGNYFAIIKTHCKLDKTVKRTDIKLVKRKDIKNKKKCLIVKNKLYYNIILNNAGYNLEDILVGKIYNKEYIEYIGNNLNKIVKHLLIGLKKMHSNNIIHFDIKPDNMGVNLKNNYMKILYLDFGLSINLDDYDEYNTIMIRGTPGFIAPDMHIISYLIHFSEKYKDINVIDNIDKLYKKIMKNVKKYNSTQYNKNWKLTKSELSIDRNSKHPNNNEFVSNEEILDITIKIANLVDNGEFLKYYSEKRNYNGFIYKYDIYSLGMSFYLIYRSLSNKENKLNDLLDLIKNMVNLDPTKRYNINQCLKHKFITGTDKFNKLNYDGVKFKRKRTLKSLKKN